MSDSQPNTTIERKEIQGKFAEENAKLSSEQILCFWGLILFVGAWAIAALRDPQLVEHIVAFVHRI